MIAQDKKQSAYISCAEGQTIHFIVADEFGHDLSGPIYGDAWQAACIASADTGGTLCGGSDGDISLEFENYDELHQGHVVPAHLACAQAESIVESVLLRRGYRVFVDGIEKFSCWASDYYAAVMEQTHGEDGRKNDHVR